MIVLISGPCGSGKTTVSRLLAGESERPSVHIHTDDFYGYIRRGYIPPWQEDSGDQNEVVINAAAACAREYARGGYDVYVDGVVGPWFLHLWRVLTPQDLRYIVLRPELEVTLGRAMAREQRAEFPLRAENVAAMWEMFRELGEYERHAVGNGSESPKETAQAIAARLRAGEFRLE